MTSGPTAAGLLLGFVADRALGDPRRWHPVAGFGRVAGGLERRLYADSRARGAAFTVILVSSAAGVGVIAERLTTGRPLARALVTGAATWAVLGGRSLESEAAAVQGFLDADNLPGARQRLTHLVGRDPSGLSADEVARAVVESVAENSADAVVSPLFWGGLLGVPGLLGYRAANTLDAMVGHRSPRYARFGWASARFDDLVNLPGARLAGLLVIGSAFDRRTHVWGAWRRDAALHPSPNAGVVEAAFAGALGVRLGGRNRYGDVVEDRVVLGDGPPPTPTDIPRATKLARRVGVGAAVVAAALAAARAARSVGD